LKLEEALALAKTVLEVLAPFCERVEVAGSIRRLRPEVNDIDIVAIPQACECKAPPRDADDIRS
jgi:DNA polymerase/3'-5' exonuclease PolX